MRSCLICVLVSVMCAHAVRVRQHAGNIESKSKIELTTVVIDAFLNDIVNITAPPLDTIETAVFQLIKPNGDIVYSIETLHSKDKYESIYVNVTNKDILEVNDKQNSKSSKTNKTNKKTKHGHVTSSKHNSTIDSATKDDNEINIEDNLIYINEEAIRNSILSNKDTITTVRTVFTNDSEKLIHREVKNLSHTNITIHGQNKSANISHLNESMEHTAMKIESNHSKVKSHRAKSNLHGTFEQYTTSYEDNVTVDSKRKHHLRHIPNVESPEFVTNYINVTDDDSNKIYLPQEPKVEIVKSNEDFYEVTVLVPKIIQIGPLQETDHGNWVLSAYYRDKNGDWVEIYQIVTITIIDPVPLVPEQPVLRIGDTFKLRFAFPIKHLETCELKAPNTTMERYYERHTMDSFCEYTVPNLKLSDAGVWTIIGVGRIVYIGEVSLRIDISNFGNTVLGGNSQF